MSDNPSLGKSVLELSTDSASFFTDLDRAKAGAGVLGASFKGAGASTKAFGDALSQTGALTRQLGGLTNDLSTSIKATALGFVSAQAILGAVQGSFRAISAFVSSSVESYASAEAALKKMTTALQAQGTATPAVIAQFNALATQFQKTTVYSDDLINEMQALLTSVGDVAPGQMDKALQAATNLAAGLGIDLRTATLMVAKASEENVLALKKAGVQLDVTRVAGEGMSYILGAINEKFGGQAQAEIETYAGKVKQLANEWDNFQEAVGRSIVEDPMLKALLSNLTAGITGVGDAAGNSSPTITEWWARLQGGTLAQNALTYINTIEGDIQAINRALAKLPAPPKAFGPQADPFAGMMAGAKTFGDALTASWVKGDAAAKKYAAAVEAGFRKWSGAAATEQMGILDANFRRLADSGKLTEKQITAMVKEALSLSEAGATLTPRLLAVALATNALSPGLSTATLDMHKLGTQVFLMIPVLDAFTKGLTYVAGIPAGSKIGTQIDIVPPKAEKARDSINDLAQAFAQLAQISEGSLSAFVRGLGSVVSSIDVAKKGMDAFNVASKAGDLAGMASGIMGVVSAGVQLGNMLVTLTATAKHPGGWLGLKSGWLGDIVGTNTQGRQITQAFADAMGGWDALHALMLATIPDAERLWKILTQTVSNADPVAAAAAVKAVQDALAASPSAAGAGYQTRAELEAVAKKAQDVYDWMLASGQYTASELAKAFQVSKDAQVAAMGDTAKAQTEALAAIDAKYKESLDKLDGEFKSLSDSVAGEAEEEFMGVIETQQRARIEQIKIEKAALEEKKGNEITNAEETYAAVLESAQLAGVASAEAIDKELREKLGRGYPIPLFPYYPDGLPGGMPAPSTSPFRMMPAPSFTGPRATDFAFSGRGPQFAANGARDESARMAAAQQTIVFKIGEREINRIVARGLPTNLIISGVR